MFHNKLFQVKKLHPKFPTQPIPLKKETQNQWLVLLKSKEFSHCRKNLLNCLESFQSLLLKNHERLESFHRKEMANQTIGGNGNKRYL
jgi:transposase-like protein